MLNDEYIAGFLDGEGCFMVGNGTPTVKVSNTNLPVLRRLQDRFEGTVRLRDQATETRRECYEWTVYGDRAWRVCKDMLPHLREKQSQAAVLMHWREESRPEIREQLAAILKELKHL